jgi:nanoRNase/pAp phosphatase (c-di-AMP/oligoRNAs hydrolase)
VDRDLLLALREGLPASAAAKVVVAAGDRNFVHLGPGQERQPVGPGPGRLSMTTEKRDIARRVHELRAFARGTDVVPILVQDDPDPDGMASALGLRTLLHRTEDTCPVISLGEVTRAENRRMAELLDLRVVRVSAAELNAFKRVIAVDTQPAPAETTTRYAVVDHHPARDGYTADFVDIRPEIGAAATMVTQYLRVGDGDGITARLATGLIYGIRTDTEVLRRGTASEDVEAYAFLQGIADQELLRKIGRPAFSEAGIRAVGRALGALALDGDMAVAYAGWLDDRTAHILPNLADFCLAIEGVSWSAAGGVVDGDLVINIRRVGGTVGAGDLAKALAEEEGMGGGHWSMARVVVEEIDRLPLGPEPGDAAGAEWLLAHLRKGVESLRALKSG